MGRTRPPVVTSYTAPTGAPTTAPKKVRKPTKAAIAAQKRQTELGKMNSYSTADVPGGAMLPTKLPPKTNADRRREVAAAGRRSEFEASPAGKARANTGVDNLIDAVGHKEALATLRRGQTDAAAWMAARVPGAHDPTIGPAVPNINAPHEVDPNIVPQRRQEDLHPTEYKRTVRAMAEHGVTPESAKTDYTNQLMQAHARAWQNHAPDPYTSRFYAGKSEPRDVINASAASHTDHPNWPHGSGVSPNTVQEAANAITSPRNKFSVADPSGQRDTLYPNDEHAYHAVQHALNVGPHGTPEQAAATIPQASGPSGGYIQGTLARATHVAHQMLYGDRNLRTVTNPLTENQAKKGQTEGNPTFGGPSQQKTTAYVGAWAHPESADAFLTTDVHTGHGFAAHLGTTKGADGKSEVENYIEKVPNVHQAHDRLARETHAELGLSPSVDNTQYLHRGQAAQWGEERISRPDLTDSTNETAYRGGQHWRGLLSPPSDREVTRAVARTIGPQAQPPERTSGTEDESWGVGQQMRADNTQAKVRRRQGSLDERTAGADPNYRSSGW